MNSSVILYVSVGFLGFFIGFLIVRMKYVLDKKLFEEKFNSLSNQNQLISNSHQTAISKLELEATFLKKEREHLQTQKEILNLQLSKKEADFDHLLDRYKIEKEEMQELQKKFRTDFEVLASKILEEKSEKFTSQNKVNLQNILNPLQEKIQQFEQRVENTHKENIGIHATLREQLLNLKDANELISKETLNLTKALKGDSKIQGNWGELILERVLEKSGLEKNREYFLQKGHLNESGATVYPDVIIHLPNDSKLVIDSKVSLLNYERFVNEEDVTQKKTYLKEHLNSVKKHVEQLSAKNYSQLYTIESPNFVLLFMPIEPAFAVALNEDNQLYAKAFDKNIIIVTPTTLLATLKTISSMWTNQKQQANALEIARQAGALYEKFEGFVLNIDKIGKKIEEANNEYESARNKLVSGKGNLITSVQKLKKLGAKTQKDLPENLVTLATENE